MARSNKASLYFVNAPVDFCFIGGFSIVAFAIFYLFFQGTTENSLFALSAALAWVGNWPHFSASNYRLYSDRNNLKQYPVTSYLVPFIVIAAVVGSFLSPVLVAPFLIKTFLLWSPYHFSGQSVGITLVYARRAGIRFSTVERYALSGFIFCTFIFPTLQTESSPAGGTFYGISYPGLAVPQWFPVVAQTWMWCCAAVFAFHLFKRSNTRKTRLPWIVMLPMVTQYVWFILGPTHKGFYLFVPFFHSVQYMLIAWALQLKLKKEEQPQGHSPKKFVAWETGRWWAINVVGGIMLFYLLPRFCTVFDFPLPFATGVFISGVQIHHFFVDGVIWKLRNTGVSQPLMVTWADLMHVRRKLRRAA